MKLDTTAVRQSDLLPTTAPPAWGRLAWGAAAVLAFAGFFTCWCDTPMIWDGAYQFCYSLISQEPYKYLTRFHSYILWTPMVWLSHVTHNLAVLKWAYGLPFTLAPAASVLLSWFMVRRAAPRLIVWAIFGVAAAPLPGQIFIINDSIFQQHMFWPVFLGLLVPLRWPQALVMAVLLVFQFSHQIGLVLLAGGCAAAMIMALRDRAHRCQFLLKSGVCGLLALLAAWKILHFPDSYAQREFTWARASEAWQWGVAGYPLRGLTSMWAAGLCALIIGLLGRGRSGHRSLMRWLAVAAIIVAAVIWCYWAGAQDGRLWADALNYRRWVVPLTVPFYLLALVDACIHRPASAGGNSEAATIGYLVAATFAVVLSIQSIVWLRLTNRLMRNVEAHSSVVVPFNDVAWMAGTPADHWGTAAYVFVREGQRPRHVLLEHFPANQHDQLRILYGHPPMVPLSPFTPVWPDPGPAGWFDFRPMLQQLGRTG